MKLNCFIQSLLLDYFSFIMSNPKNENTVVCFTTDDFKFWLWCVWGQVMLQVMN